MNNPSALLGYSRCSLCHSTAHLIPTCTAFPSGVSRILRLAELECCFVCFAPLAWHRDTYCSAVNLFHCCYCLARNWNCYHNICVCPFLNEGSYRPSVFIQHFQPNRQ